MPRFKVIEIRKSRVEYVIESDDAAKASELQGEIESETVLDSWGYELESCEMEDEN